MKPLYIPKGKANEYGDYAVNIYTGCPHRCYYCFAPNVLHRDRETFHTNVAPRPGLVEALKQQLEKEQVKGQLIHLTIIQAISTGSSSGRTWNSSASGLILTTTSRIPCGKKWRADYGKIVLRR